MITATHKGKRYEVEYSVVNVSELEGALRLDAENYEPRLFEIQRKIESKKYDILSNLATNEYKVFRPKDCEEFYYLEISNVDTSTGEYELEMIPCSLAPSRAKKVVEEKDVLISTVRPNRNAVAIALQIKEKPFVASTGFCKLRVISREITAEYLFVLFKTEYFRDFLVRKTTATMYPAVSEEDIMSLKIPILSDTFQKQIQNLVLRSYDEKEKSVSLYKKAEDTLLEELGLKDWKPKTKKIFVGGKEYEEEENISIRNLSEVLKADRMDAEYWEPKYEDILKTVSLKYDLLPIKSIFDFRRGVFISTDYYTEEKTNRPYIRIKELTGRIGINEDEVIYINDAYQEDVADRLRENDLVIAIIGDTIGKTNRVYEELAGGFCSNNTGRLRIRADAKGKIIPEYAEILFQSIIVQNQIEKKKAQTGQPKISDGEMKSIFIPLLPLEIQQKLASLVQQSHEARKKSKKLLEIAKRAVEIAIEKNEEEALSYIAENSNS